MQGLPSWAPGAGDTTGFETSKALDGALWAAGPGGRLCDPRTCELERAETFPSDRKSKTTLFGLVLNYKLLINNNKTFKARYFCFLLRSGSLAGRSDGIFAVQRQSELIHIQRAVHASWRQEHTPAPCPFDRGHSELSHASGGVTSWDNH